MNIKKKFLKHVDSNESVDYLLNKLKEEIYNIHFKLQVQPLANFKNLVCVYFSTSYPLAVKIITNVWYSVAESW